MTQTARKPHGNTIIPKEDCFKIYEWKEQGKSSPWIAAMLGRNAAVVANIATGRSCRKEALKEWLELTGRKEYIPQNSRMATPSKIRKCIRMKLGGFYTNEEIAKTVGMSVTWVATTWRKYQFDQIKEQSKCL